MKSRNKLTVWAGVVAMIVSLALPVISFAAPVQGRGHGRDKKEDKFKNGHDARDGRYDGRGPRGERGDYDDDDDRYDDRDNRNYRRDRRDDDNRRDRNGRNGNYNRTDIRNRASQIGYDEGYRAGQDDRAGNRSFDYRAHNTYQDATAGYDSNYNDRELYRRYFQDAYRRGYQDGYDNNRGARRRTSGIGDVLGGILGGRP